LNSIAFYGNCQISTIFAPLTGKVMIQRIQTVYLAVVIILLTFVTLGSEIFSFVNETARYTFNSYGIMKFDIVSGKLISQQSFPFYLGTIGLILLSFITLMSYKNLNRQFKLGRTVFGIYFLMLISIFLLSYFGESLLDTETSSREMGLGFLLFVVGFPFTFLANTGIKRDKKLLDSLDRLR
jgi:hypothetical protein